MVLWSSDGNISAPSGTDGALEEELEAAQEKKQHTSS